MLSRIQSSDSEIGMTVVTGCNHDKLDLLVGHKVFGSLVPLCLREIIQAMRTLLPTLMRLCMPLQERMDLETFIGENKG
jgi:hypothetical protein